MRARLMLPQHRMMTALSCTLQAPWKRRRQQANDLQPCEMTAHLSFRPLLCISVQTKGIPALVAAFHGRPVGPFLTSAMLNQGG